jgi:hypothetical protein
MHIIFVTIMERREREQTTLPTAARESSMAPLQLKENIMVRFEVCLLHLTYYRFIGCPFKHFDQIHLREKLSSVGLNSNNASTAEILDLAARGHFQVACQRYFVAMHPGAIPEKVGMHPNAYYDESRKFIDARTESSESEMNTQSDSQ